MKASRTIAIVFTLALLIAALLAGPAWAERAGIWLGRSPAEPKAGANRAAFELPSSSVLSSVMANTEEIACEDYACLGVSGGVLRPTFDDVTWQYGGDGGCIYADSGNANRIWSAPVYLPQGVIVTQLIMYAADLHNTRNSTAWLAVYDHSGDSVAEWEVKTSGRSGVGSWASTPFSHEVDHSSYHYVVHWQPNELGADMQLCGFLIDYQPLPRDGMGTDDQAYELGDELWTAMPYMGGFATDCTTAVPPVSELPAVLALDRGSIGNQSKERTICLYGFPVGKPIEIRMFTPDGENEQYGAFQINDPSLARPTPTPAPTPTRSGSTGQLIHPPSLLPNVIQNRTALQRLVATPVPIQTTTPGEFRRILNTVRLYDYRIVPPVVQLPKERDVKPLKALQLEPVAVAPDESAAFASQPDAWRVDNVTVLSVPLWWPVGMPPGVWVVQAAAAGAETSVPLFFESTQGITTRPDAQVNAFVNLNCALYEPGDKVVIEGAGFDPNQRQRLGFYQSENARLSLADSAWTVTDDEGSFALPQTIKSTYRAGTYYIVKAPTYGSILTSGLPCFQVYRE